METIIDFNKLTNSVSDTCLGIGSCGSCDGGKCLVGYSKQSLITSMKNNEQFIDGGMDDIPLFDTKIFDDVHMVDSIGVILNQCKNCNAYHDEECIVNILRSACEIALFGEPEDYPGSALVYLKKIESINPELSSKIFGAYLKNKN